MDIKSNNEKKNSQGNSIIKKATLTGASVGLFMIVFFVFAGVLDKDYQWSYYSLPIFGCIALIAQIVVTTGSYITLVIVDQITKVGKPPSE